VLAVASAAALSLLDCSADAAGAPPERRCVELGSGCVCAEALDFAGEVPPSTFFDPPDSTSRECTQAGQRPPWLPVFLRLGGRGVVPGGPDGAPALPAGATSKHVLKENGSGGSDHIMNDLDQDGSGGRLDVTGKTLCIRGYVSYSQDHPLPGNIKIARMGNAGAGLAWQSSWGSGTGLGNSPIVSFIADFQADGTVDVDCNLAAAASPDPITFGDCRGHWCRYEICADHPPAGVPSVRARFLQVGGPSHTELGPEMAYCHQRLPAVTSLQVKGQLVIMDLHGEALAGPAETGARFLSHGLVTLTPYDSTFWPGPARELEGVPAD
jgi:hypothetical protein